MYMYSMQSQIVKFHHVYIRYYIYIYIYILIYQIFQKKMKNTQNFLFIFFLALLLDIGRMVASCFMFGTYLSMKGMEGLSR